MTFCWLPPERLATGVRMLGVRMSNSRARCSAVVKMTSCLQGPGAGEGGQVIGVEHQVVGDRETEHQAVLLTVLRDVGNALLQGAAAARR